jgi:hypothetical protein
MAAPSWSNQCSTNHFATSPLLSDRSNSKLLKSVVLDLAAAEMVKDGETIALGAGTTTTEVGRSLRHRKGITVVTNALNIAMELSHRANLKIIITGGSMSSDSFALTGSLGIAVVGDMFYDKAFIGVDDGIHPDHGLTTNCPDQAHDCFRRGVSAGGSRGQPRSAWSLLVESCSFARAASETLNDKRFHGFATGDVIPCVRILRI